MSILLLKARSKGNLHNLFLSRRNNAWIGVKSESDLLFFLSLLYIISERMFWLHSQAISLSLTNLTKTVFLWPQITFPKSRTSPNFSIMISGMVMLAMSSRLYLAPFLTSMGTMVLDFPNFMFFFAWWVIVRVTSSWGGSLVTLSGAILKPRFLAVFWSKLKSIGIWPTFVILKTFFF